MASTPGSAPQPPGPPINRPPVGRGFSPRGPPLETHENSLSRPFVAYQWLAFLTNPGYNTAFNPHSNLKP
jgi:hypothetical protein